MTETFLDESPALCFIGTIDTLYSDGRIWMEPEPSADIRAVPCGNTVSLVRARMFERHEIVAYLHESDIPEANDLVFTRTTSGRNLDRVLQVDHAPIETRSASGERLVVLDAAAFLVHYLLCRETIDGFRPRKSVP